MATTLTAPGGPPPSRGLGIAALVVGIIAFLLGLVPWLGLILAIAAVAIGIAALVKKQPLGLALTGLILGGIALIAGLVMTIAFSAAMTSALGQRDTPADVTSSDTEPDPEVEASDEAPDEAETEAEPSGSADDPLPQPYTATGLLGGEKYTLTARIVDADANELVQSWNQFNDEAPSGFKYVIVELTMTGIDEDGVEPSLANFDLFLATAEGNRYSNEFIVFGDDMPSMSDGPTLYPGSTFTGYTAYVVPDGAESFLIYDNGNYVSF